MFFIILFSLSAIFPALTMELMCSGNSLQWFLDLSCVPVSVVLTIFCAEVIFLPMCPTSYLSTFNVIYHFIMYHLALRWHSTALHIWHLYHQKILQSSCFCCKYVKHCSPLWTSFYYAISVWITTFFLSFNQLKGELPFLSHDSLGFFKCIDQLTFTGTCSDSFSIVRDTKSRISLCSLADFFRFYAYEFYPFLFLWFGFFFFQSGNETPWSVTPQLSSAALLKLILHLPHSVPLVPAWSKQEVTLHSNEAGNFISELL